MSVAGCFYNWDSFILVTTVPVGHKRKFPGSNNPHWWRQLVSGNISVNLGTHEVCLPGNIFHYRNKAACQMDNSLYLGNKLYWQDNISNRRNQEETPSGNQPAQYFFRSLANLFPALSCSIGQYRLLPLQPDDYFPRFYPTQTVLDSPVRQLLNIIRQQPLTVPNVFSSSTPSVSDFRNQPVPDKATSFENRYQSFVSWKFFFILHSPAFRPYRPL